MGSFIGSCAVVWQRIADRENRRCVARLRRHGVRKTRCGDSNESPDRVKTGAQSARTSKEGERQVRSMMKVLKQVCVCMSWLVTKVNLICHSIQFKAGDPKCPFPFFYLWWSRTTPELPDSLTLHVNPQGRVSVSPPPAIPPWSHLPYSPPTYVPKNLNVNSIWKVHYPQDASACGTFHVFLNVWLKRW